MRRVNLLRAHGSPTQYLYIRGECRCTLCRSEHAHHQRRYRVGCPEKTAENNRRYNAKNHAKRAALNRLYYAVHREEIRHHRAERREEIAEYDRLYCAAHRDERRASNTAYDVAHPGKRAACCRNYRARKRGAPGTHTAADTRAQYDRQKGRCYWCGAKIAWRKKHVDHVIPLVLGGSNAPANLVISCPTCNQKKHAKHPMDFAGRML